MFRNLFLSLVILLGMPGAIAEERIALVIGNADYPPEVGRLANTHDDAERIHAALTSVGFRATLVKDQTDTQLKTAVATFQADLLAHPGAIGFFYYSGHGASADLPGVGRKNYLIPSGSPVTTAEQLPLFGVRMDEIVGMLSAAKSKAIFVVSDACRNTLPFSTNKSSGEADKGFVPINSPPSMLIAYATAEGATAPDDGQFSQALAAAIQQESQDASEAFLRALQRVARGRPGGKLPFFTPGLIPEDVCFVSCDGGVRPGDAAAWAAVQDDCEAEYYLSAFPSGAYAAAANIRLRRCQAQSSPLETAAAVAQSPEDLLAEELAGMDYLNAGFSTRTTLRDIDERYDFDVLVSLAEKGDANASLLLGRAYYDGLNVEEDKSLANTYFKSACYRGQSIGCNYVGVGLVAGEIEQKNAVEGASFYKRACDGGNTYGCSNLGSLYNRGEGVEQDHAQANHFYRLACDGGYMNACNSLALNYRQGLGTEKNEAEAVGLYRLACENEEMRGCDSLGDMYLAGLGVEKDEAEAIAFYRKACDGELMISCLQLGYMYDYGQGVKQDQVEAVRLYRIACDGGSTSGCKNLALMYNGGIGIGRDRTKATELFKAACDENDYEGCGYVGRAYQYGIGVARDYAEADRYYQLGCDGDANVRSCNGLAWMLATSTDADVRDGPRAIALALKALETEPNSVPARDTLAAAYAEAGRFEDAVREQEAAIAGGGTSAQFHERLELYKNGQPFRE